MRLLCIAGLFLFFPVFLKAQSRLDSFHLLLSNASSDTVRMNLYDQLGWYYAEINRDSALYYFEQELPVARKLNMQLYEADALNGKGSMLRELRNYPESLKAFLEAQRIVRDPAIEKYAWNLTGNAWNTSKNPDPKIARLNLLGWILNDVGNLYGTTGNTVTEISNLSEARNLAAFVGDTTLLEVTNSTLGWAYFYLNKLDSALHFQQNALSLYERSDVFKKYEGDVLISIGRIYQKKGQTDSSRETFLQSIASCTGQHNISGLAAGYFWLADLYHDVKKNDSSLHYVRKALETFRDLRSPSGISDSYRLLATVYGEQNKPDSAFAFLKMAFALKDSINNADRTNLLAFKNRDFDEILQLRKLEEEKIQTRSNIRTWALVSGIAVFILISFLLYRNNKNRQKANALLQQQNEEIELQKRNVEGTLAELKATQSQLIQSEKMASLGQLTAGIAHEIQNPLNFVNNFSDLNKEMLEELKAERSKPDAERDESAQDEIINDILSNEEKINHHGRRADSIVKSMLQHSQQSAGEKVLADINAMAGECLRLAYHGIRAKDPSFEAILETDFATQTERIDMIPQAIGKVLLNLLNNAFYAVHEKQKSLSQQQDIGYKPVVSVQTKRSGEQVFITVSDNGNGIPENIIDKIYQPFFTTKPTGEGTGLGLSLAYDIVKAHGGELKLSTKEGEGSSFLITLPVS
ncbi:MAG: tetratricopeptide repeat-containing sensor histidine kinase [Chitinophagaceae bacterium]